MSLRVGIGGYGNVGRGVEQALARVDDLTLAAIVTRRERTDVEASVPVISYDELDAWHDRIDVLILCEGSALDLPELGPELATRFHTVDSFDTHERIPDYFAAMDTAARSGGKVAVLAVGWDPGLFSLNRLFAEAVLPQGQTYTFWGRGVSQGHSNAIRRIPGVIDAIQYTVPIETAVAAARSGRRPRLSPREMHTRECVVVVEPTADRDVIEAAIRQMPNYFDAYDTTVQFVTLAQLRRDHSAMPHGGFVIRSGVTGYDDTEQVIEYRLLLGSNPQFTASVMVAYARAAGRLAAAGECGARTAFDIAPALLSPHSPARLRATLL